MSRLGAIAVPATVAAEVDDLAMRAWPARLVEPLGGWRLAFTPGLATRRINSVQAKAWHDGPALEAAVERVEAFYAARSMPARFRLTALSRPEGLDDWLATRGYAVEAPTDVMVADLAAMATESQRHETQLASAPFDDWTRLWLAGSVGDDVSARRELLTRMPSGARFGLLRLDGEAAALGLMVLEGRWGGIFGMRTEPRFRRRALATALLDAFAREARGRGAERLYLQVEQDNPAAQALYRRAGFTFAYSYHYRRRPPSSCGSCS